MSNVITLPARARVVAHSRVAARTERGSQTAEFGVTALVAVALALCLFGLIRGGMFDGVISALIEGILSYASSLIGR